jgi:hypothetical protein
MPWMLRLFISWALLANACVGATGKLEPIRLSADGKGFVRGDSARPFIVWGVNYDRDYKMRLIEDYWDKEWSTVESAFRQIQRLGANVVRVHLQFAKFMEAPDKPNAAALARLEKLVTLAEKLGLYLDVTGLGCYRLEDQPQWYERMVEKDRWAAQAAFWDALAKCCAGRAGVMAFDLINEPAVGDKRAPGTWEHEAALGGFHYVQFITLDQGGRDAAELWRQWTHTLVNAIRKQDKHRLVTVGLLPLPGRDMLSGLSQEVDYMSVHIYPKAGKVDDDIRTLKLFSVGKPLIIEEIFPLECSAAELLDFIRKSKGIASGWISFYWGQPIADLKSSKVLGDQMLLSWLEQFQKMAPTIRGEQIGALLQQQ